MTTHLSSLLMMLGFGFGGLGFAVFSVAERVGRRAGAEWWKEKLRESRTSTREPPPLRFPQVPVLAQRLSLRAKRRHFANSLLVGLMLDEHAASDPVSKKAARAITTATSRPAAERKITTLAGSEVAGIAP
jgi:hypothetical protein